jgi:Zn-dependent protease
MSFERRRTFSWTEIQHIIVAWLVLGLAFSVAVSRPFNINYLGLFLQVFMISLLTIGAGFVGHELTHKFVAQRYGCLAEFRMWPLGLILALFFAFFLGVVFAAPGAVYITPASFGLGAGITRRENGIISLSGPLTNVLLAAIFFLLTFFNGLLYDIGSLGFFINLFLAAFNLIPFPPMDGHKVFVWSKGIWAIVAIPLWAVVIILIY